MKASGQMTKLTGKVASNILMVLSIKVILSKISYMVKERKNRKMAILIQVNGTMVHQMVKEKKL